MMILWLFVLAFYIFLQNIISFLKCAYLKMQSQRVKVVQAILNLLYLSRGSFRGFVNFN